MNTNGKPISRRVRWAIAALPFVTCLVPIDVSACIWTYGTDLRGVPKEFAKGGYDLKHVALNGRKKDHWMEKQRELEAKLQTNDDFRTRSDFAAVLLHVGETGRAIEILKKVESDNPGEYIVAANLGTAYELAGDNVKALEWIKKGIERNADSHYGTEWLHVRILEAKIELDADPTWLQNHSVLGLDFGSDPEPQQPNRGSADNLGERLSLQDTARAIEYQLHERLQFVSPPEAIVADLLFDLGNLIALTETVEEAIPMYELAETYDPSPPSLLQLRAVHMRSIAEKNLLSGMPGTGLGVPLILFYASALLIPVGVFAIGLVLRRRRLNTNI